MPDETGILLKDAITLLFNDTSKAIADLKSRQWSATTLAVAGLVFLDKFGRANMNHANWLPYLMVLVLVAYCWVIVRCVLNIRTFRQRLELIVKDSFPIETYKFLQPAKKTKPGKEEFVILADEGTIIWVDLLCPK